MEFEDAFATFHVMNEEVVRCSQLLNVHYCTISFLCLKLAHKKILDIINIKLHHRMQTQVIGLSASRSLLCAALCAG